MSETDLNTNYGPKRHAPEFYAGETYGRRKMLYPDVDRHPNGALPSKRNKLARRLTRSAFKRSFSRVERGLKLPRALLAQARVIAKDTGKSSRWARRLFARELAIHKPVYVPSQKELRAMRTERRKLKRQGKQDAISALIDRMVTRDRTRR